MSFGIDDLLKAVADKNGHYRQKLSMLYVVCRLLLAGLKKLRKPQNDER